MRFFVKVAVLVLACSHGWAAGAADAPLPVKVVVVSMFEHGALTGDRPGEFQYWVERMPLDQEFAFPGGEYPLSATGTAIAGSAA